MAVSKFTQDKFVLGPFTTTASGIILFDVPCATADQIYRIIARCYVVLASASHLSTCGAFIAEYVVSNKNGTLATVAAVASSTNPDNFSGLVAQHPEAADTNANTTTGTFAVSGTNARLTVTVQSAGSPLSGASVFLVGEIERCGAT